MIVARAPSDEGLIIFSVDEGLLSGSGRGNGNPNDEGEGEGGGLPLPTHWSPTQSSSKESVMLEVLRPFLEVAWCGLGDQATARLWQRLPGSLSICKTAAPKLEK